MCMHCRELTSRPMSHGAPSMTSLIAWHCRWRSGKSIEFLRPWYEGGQRLIRLFNKVRKKQLQESHCLITRPTADKDIYALRKTQINYYNNIGIIRVQYTSFDFFLLSYGKTRSARSDDNGKINGRLNGHGRFLSTEDLPLGTDV